MRRLIALTGLSLTFLFADSGLPSQFCPAYSSYETARVLAPGNLGLGFATHNFCLFGADSISYDRRTYDLYFRLGLAPGLELGLKHAAPTAGLLSLKYRLSHHPIPLAIQLGGGYMKATLENYWTYYVFDLYPQLLASFEIRPGLEPYLIIKTIYSHYIEENGKDTHGVFSYGGTIGLALGPDYFKLMPEVNRLKGSERGKAFTVVQFGLGVMLYKTFAE